MDSHENARTTPHGRMLIVRRLSTGQSVSAVAAAMGVTPKTVRKWRDRSAAEGEAGLRDRSARPLRCPTRLPPETTAQIKELRHQRRSGPAIARQLGLPVSTVGLELRRLGLNRLKALDPKPEIIRYEREHPGELIHIDIKKLGRIDGVGHRITGNRTGQSNKRSTGWEYLHVAIDDASRLAFTAMMPDERKESAVAFLDAAIAWFHAHGVVVQRVMTDNGSAYIGLQKQGLCRRHRGARPEAQAHPTLHAQDQRQGRTLHSDQYPRVGLCDGLPILRRAHPRHAPLAARLQHRQAALCPQRKVTRQPHQRGQCPWQ